jgi:hypothetical protein
MIGLFSARTNPPKAQLGRVFLDDWANEKIGVKSNAMMVDCRVALNFCVLINLVL